MTLHYTDDHLTVHVGDCREVLATLPAESVHCVVTSPPYWGLRDYGTATWAGGDEGCDHAKPNRNAETTTMTGGTSTLESRHFYGATCGKCGATRQDSQLGLEPTPEAYVANMVAVFREVRRVLRSDGTVWLNLGDSYAAARSYQVRDNKHIDVGNTMAAVVPDGLKPKDLVGIPWRLAFALQADGWYLRSDIIWSKPNPMPESVTDRPTKSHEYVFLLTKSARYFYDADAVREPHKYPDDTDRYRGKERGEGEFQVARLGYEQRVLNPAGRNLRSVWTIATEPYPGAHFATFPQKLVGPCIKAGCPEGGTVLDPFAGSGTTGLVANRLGRRAILIDLSADYIDQAMLRNQQAPLGLTTP